MIVQQDSCSKAALLVLVIFPKSRGMSYSVLCLLAERTSKDTQLAFFQVQVLVRIRPASKPRKPHFEMLDCQCSTTVLEIKQQVKLIFHSIHLC